MKTNYNSIKEIIDEFRLRAYPIVHSNTFPEKDEQYLDELCHFIDSALHHYEGFVRDGEKKRIADGIEAYKIRDEFIQELSAEEQRIDDLLDEIINEEVLQLEDNK